MEKGRKPDLFTPTIQQAKDAVKIVASFYGCPNNNFPADSSLTYREAEKKLLDLASNINNGTVYSHIQVAKILWELGSLIDTTKPTPIAAHEFAAWGVYVAVLQKQKSFSSQEDA